MYTISMFPGLTFDDIVAVQNYLSLWSLSLADNARDVVNGQGRVQGSVKFTA